jgi:tRNA modification GTPase
MAESFATSAPATTIVAIATAQGQGGIGVVRLSGPEAYRIGCMITGQPLKPRYAHYVPFQGDCGLLDQGIALYFATPHSFTGEDVVELQGHGGPVVLDLLVNRCLQLGANLAKPGEFSERAFLNGKLDLAQAEAIADLINASTTQAARLAVQSLQGEFSQRIDQLVERLIALRLYVEAAIDFPEEEIDFLSEGPIAEQLTQLKADVESVLASAKQGSLLREGMTLVLAGRPNAGKSSLLNRLAGQDLAIVTPVAGTTRDSLRESIHLDGLPLHLVDTAGLRESDDLVEQIGISRAWTHIDKADRILLVIDASDPGQHAVKTHWPEFFSLPDRANKLTLIYNKSDQVGSAIPGLEQGFWVSAQTGEGIEPLKTHLKALMGYTGTTEGHFIARRRHLDAIHKAQQSLNKGLEALIQHRAGELLAEDLRQAQEALGSITGRVTPDDLLGRIFSSFCIGK